MTEELQRKPALLLSALAGLALFLAHLVVNRNYGFHGDELYFLMCGLHPDWGYVDHPPFTPLIARLGCALFGVSYAGFRFFSALSLGVSCFLTGWLAKRLGAGWFGQALALLAFIAAPVFVRAGAFLNIPVFEALFWLLMAHALVTVCRRDDARWWVLAGAFCGLAMLNKHTALFFGIGMGAGLVLTRRRKDLLTPWPWLGGALAVAIFSPNLIWQYRHGWATLEFLRNLNAEVMQRISAADFLIGQAAFLNLASVAVWVAGLVWLLRAREGRPYAMLAWIYLCMLVLFLALKAKQYYLAPAYPMLFAAGAVALEQWTASGRWRWLRYALPAAMIAVVAAFFPIAAPVGGLAWQRAYADRYFAFAGGAKTMLFDLGFQLGRNEEVAAMAACYQALPAAEKNGCAVYPGYYDVASAVDLFGADYGLPQAICGSNNFYLWGPGDWDGQRMITLRCPRSVLDACFKNVIQAGVAPPRMPEDKTEGVPIYYCSEPNAPLEQLWPKFKAYPSYVRPK